MPCSTCADLPERLAANTGRGVHLPAAFHELTRRWNTSQLRDFDALQCPECGAWFEWRDDSSSTGSGHDDEETLTRLPSATSALFQGLLRGELADPAAFFDEVFTHPFRELLLRALASGPSDAFERLVPLLVERLARATSDGESAILYGMLQSRATDTLESAQRLAALLRAQPQPLKGRASSLLGLCRRR